MEVEDKLKQAVGMMGEEDMKRAVEGMMMGDVRNREDKLLEVVDMKLWMLLVAVAVGKNKIQLYGKKEVVAMTVKAFRMFRTCPLLFLTCFILDQLMWTLKMEQNGLKLVQQLVRFTITLQRGVVFMLSQVGCAPLWGLVATSWWWLWKSHVWIISLMQDWLM